MGWLFQQIEKDLYSNLKFRVLNIVDEIVDVFFIHRFHAHYILINLSKSLFSY